MSILSEAPIGAQILDLGAARAARAEARVAAGDSGSYLKLAAGYVAVKEEIALSAAFDLQSGNVKGGLSGLLVDPADVDALLADGLSTADFEAITKFISGAGLGESTASPKP